MTPLVIGVGGEPAAGKSTVVQLVLAGLGPGTEFCRGLVRGTLHGPLDNTVAVLGLYGPSDYPGTDRLSMAVQPAAVRFVNDVAAGAFPVHAVLFEGDRLFNASFLAACRGALPASEFLVLTASEAARADRRAGRGDTKPPGFLAGRASKYRNILAACPYVRAVPNETPDQAAAAAGYVLDRLARSAAPAPA